MSSFTLRVLGAFELRIGSGPPLLLPTRKAEALLAYLALPPGREHPRDQLTALLWPDAGDRRARHSLRQALFSLRKALPAGPVAEEIVAEGDHIALNPRAVDVDAITFERRVREGTLAALEPAIDLYRGDLLEGLAFREPAFEEWLVPERERLRELAQKALAKLAGLHERGDNLEASIEATQRLLALDPLQEAAHRMLMRLYARDGRRGAALRQYQSCLSVLKRDLGAEPEAETRQLYHELLRRRSTGASVHESPRTERAPDRDPALATRGRGRGDTPLIGRDAELGQLRQCLERARRGQDVVAAVIGEAGVGKSRLLQDFLAEAVGADARVLIGRAYEMEGALPLGPWIDALRGGLGPALPELEGFSPVWTAHLRRLLPDLWPEPPPTPAGDGVPRLFEAIAELLRHLASRRPLLVALEDLHWADAMSLNLLSFLARRISGWPVMVVATAREEELTASATQVLRALDVEERMISVPVVRLSRRATLTLVRALGRSGRRPATARLASRIWAVSEGNPFMVVETLRVVDEVGRARMAGRLPLPDRIRNTIIGRLERLTERGQRLAAAAAVIGREFEFTLLQRTAGLGERQTAEATEELVRRGVLRASGEQFEFTHDSIRKVAYEQLLAPRRDTLHLAVARSLEALYAERLEGVHDRLAYHYSRTSHAAKAVAYLTRSAEGASRRHAAADAVRSLERALTHADRLPASERDRARLDVSLRLAVALSILGRFDEILKRLGPLGELVERLDDPSVAGAYHARLALTHCNVGAHDEARRSAHRAIAAAMRSGDDVTRGQAHYVLSIEGFSGGRAGEGLADGRRAVELLERAGERRWVGQAYWIVGLNHLLLGDFERALAAAGHAESIGTALGDQELEGFATTVVAWIHVIRGAWTEAMETARRSLKRSPDPANKATALGLAAMAELASGPIDGDRLATALRVLEQSVQQLSRFGFRQSVMLIYLAEAHLLGGDTNRAEGLAARGLALARERGFAWGVAAAERLLGRIAHAQGALLDARGHLEQALEIFAGVPARFEVALTRLTLAAVAHSQGRAADACAYLDDALPALRNQGPPRALEAAEQLLEAIRPQSGGTPR